MVTADATRLLCLHTPGTCEAFYRCASAPINEVSPADRTVDFDRVMRSAKENGGIEILGPPPFSSSRLHDNVRSIPLDRAHIDGAREVGEPSSRP